MLTPKEKRPDARITDQNTLAHTTDFLLKTLPDKSGNEERKISEFIFINPSEDLDAENFNKLFTFIVQHNFTRVTVDTDKLNNKYLDFYTPNGQKQTWYLRIDGNSFDNRGSATIFDRKKQELSFSYQKKRTSQTNLQIIKGILTELCEQNRAEQNLGDQDINNTVEEIFERITRIRKDH